MAEHTNLPTPPERLGDVDAHLAYLKLPFIAAQDATLAKDAAHKAWSHVDYLARLLEGEAAMRRDRATKSRLRLARFPVINTVEQCRGDWPTRMNRLQVPNHFRLAFLQDKANLICLGGVGLGKPQPGNYPVRSQRRTGTNHHRRRSPPPPVWSHVHAGRYDASCATGPVLRGVAAAL